MHTLDPALAEYVAGHPLQDAEPCKDTVPPAQVLHVDTFPAATTLLLVPAAHRVHTVSPSAAQEPAKQAVQVNPTSVEEGTEMYPVRHLQSKGPDPATDTELPGQAVHWLLPWME